MHYHIKSQVQPPFLQLGATGQGPAVFLSYSDFSVLYRKITKKKS